MTVTLADLKNEVKHALDGGQPSGCLTLMTLINDAGRMFYDIHPWKFKQRAKATLATQANNQKVVLPTDFASHVEIKRNTAGITLVSLGEIALQDAGEARTSSSGFYLGTIIYPNANPAATNAPPVPYLLIAPTPSADNNDAFDLYYRAQWVDLVEQASEVDGDGVVIATVDTDVAHVPSFAEATFKEFAALYARGKEHDRFLESIEVFSKSEAFRLAKRADGRQQSEYGRVTGGAIQMQEGRRTSDFLASESASPPA